MTDRKKGKYPSAVGFIIDLIVWRKESGECLREIKITEWMADIVRDELGELPVKIDGIAIEVVRDSGCRGVRRGLLKMGEGSE